MKNKTIIEWLKELPLDYDLCLSEQTAVVLDESEEAIEYTVVLDKPILGILKNDETKEIRFFTKITKEYLDGEIKKGNKWRKIE